MGRAIITDVQYILPDNVETNDFLVADMNLSWSADDIFDKTGIKQRHIVRENECASDLGFLAAEKLLSANEGIKDKIDFVLFCSQSPDYALPATAPLLQKRLGLSKKCGSLDINQGCSGYIYGLAVAKGLVESGMSSNLLLITAETYSKYIAKDDKATRTIFGDGAAATLIQADEKGKGCLNGFVFGSDGRGMNNLIVHNSGARKNEQEDAYLFMDGPEIFQFTLGVVPKTVKEILLKTRLQLDEIDYFIFHQANAFILEHLRNKMKIPQNKFFMDLADTGNTVSASIPIALSRAKQRGLVHSGMKVMLLGFGVGYSWGGCILEI